MVRQIPSVGRPANNRFLRSRSERVLDRLAGLKLWYRYWHRCHVPWGLLQGEETQSLAPSTHQHPLNPAAR